ncbi:MAG: radical SAM protein [Desulfovibrionales bacterium]
MEFSYLFGPVRSGRLGRSLGLDLLGDRICSFDCLYCEVGRTRIKTLERKPYVPAEKILGELKGWFSLGLARPDFLTMGGQGEPCLNSELEAILRGVHTIAPSTPRAILTNSSLLGEPDVRKALQLCEVVLPSLDTLVQEEFIRLNRPESSIEIESLKQDMLAWREEFRGLVYLEVLLVRGFNDSDRNRERLARFCERLQPDRVDVVTLTRPGAFPSAKSVDEETLASFRRDLKAAPVQRPDVPAAAEKSSASADPKTAEGLVLGSLRRRPQTSGQLQFALGLEQNLVAQTLQKLQKEKKIIAIDSNGMSFYSLCRTS